MIRCSSCGVDKSVSEFYPSVVKESTQVAECKLCRAGRTKAWASTHREEERARVARSYRRHRAARCEASRWSRFKSKYGVTKDQYIVMLARQEHQCRICNSSLVGAPKTSIDHSHNTGAVRGILCNSCNLGIGLFKDNPAVLTRAAHYVTTQGV